MPLCVIRMRKNTNLADSQPYFDNLIKSKLKMKSHADYLIARFVPHYYQQVTSGLVPHGTVILLQL